MGRQRCLTIAWYVAGVVLGTSLALMPNRLDARNDIYVMFAVLLVVGVAISVGWLVVAKRKQQLETERALLHGGRIECAAASDRDTVFTMTLLRSVLPLSGMPQAASV